MQAELRPVGSAGPLRKRRLIVALLLVLLLPVGLGVAALRYQRPAPPPAETAVVGNVLPQVPDAMARAQFDRSRAASRLAGRLTRPELVPPARLGPAGAAAGPLPTLALSPRVEPYTLAEVRRLVPIAFLDLGPPGPGSAVLIDAHLEVPQGATLVIDAGTPDVRLPSSPAGFATIISRGTVTVAGTAERPVRISTWDLRRGTPDSDASDGRSFVLQAGGRMDVDHSRFEFLGFGTGSTSGVAWNGTLAEGSDTAARTPVFGTVTSSLFARNHIGAYTNEATDMRWVGNTFADNVQYGFDPHTFSSGFLVEGNTASGNGKHGFIFSRGCSRNVMRANFAHDNAGHGFMIDNGRSRATDFAEIRVDDSDDNLIVDNVAQNNAGSGVEIEGGTGNVVRGNRLIGNYVGVRVKDGASVTVSDNQIVDSARYGIDVLDSVDQIPVTGNSITGTWGAINLPMASNAALAANTTVNVSTPLVVAGVAVRELTWLDQVARYVRWNPLLVLWGLVLGVPMLVGMARLVSSPVLARRRRIPVA